MKLKAAIFCLIFTAGSLTVEASPALNGNTGLLVSPTADVLQAGEGSAGIWKGASWKRQSIALGLPGRLEIAHSFIDTNGVGSRRDGFKISLKNEGVLVPGLAVGMESGGAIYAVAGKFLPGGYRLHLGIGSKRTKGAFGGLEKVLNPPRLGQRRQVGEGPLLKAIADFDGSVFHYGLRAVWKNGLQGQIAHSPDGWHGGVTFNW